MYILEAKNISYTYPQMQEKALESVSLKIEKGSYTAILGENGSGKSTLGKIIAGILSPDEGEIIFAKDSLKTQTGIVFQSPKHQIIAGNVLKDTSLGPENLGESRIEAKKTAHTILEKIGLSEKISANTLNLSLGQMQKLAMAGIIALSPELIIFDEALSMIDPTGRKDLLEVIDTLHHNGMTIISITHDEDEAKKANRIYFMKKGKIHSIIENKDFETNKELHEYFNTPSERAFETSIQKQKEKKTQNQNSVQSTSLYISNISFSYKNTKNSKDEDLFFNKLSLEFCSHSLIAIMGPSGSGKTTLFELISGLLIPSQGKVCARGKVSLSLQDANAALFEEFAVDDIAFGPRNQGLRGQALVNRVKDSMQYVSLDYDEFKNKKTFALSGGQKRKVSLAGIIALDHDILLFDEPTAGLDPKSRFEVMQTMMKLAKKGKTIIFSTHRKEEALLADRLLVLEEGKLIYDSKPCIINEEKNSLTHTETNSKIKLQELKRDEAKILAQLQKSIQSDYANSNSILHKAKPLWKSLFFLVFFILSIAIQKTTNLGFLLFFSLLYLSFSKYPLKKILVRILKVLPWITLLLVFQILFFGSRENDIIYLSYTLFSKWTLTISNTKIALCIKTFLHFINALIALSVFMYTSTETEIIEGFEDILLPLKLLHIPTKNILLFFLLVFRFIPLLLDEASAIVKTQVIREGMKNTKGFFKTIKTFIPLFVPLIIQTIKRAENLTEAIIARKF